MPAAVLLLALTAMLAGCGDSDDEPSGSPTSSTEAEATSDPAAGLDADAVEASILEFLETNEYAADLAPAVDCVGEAPETVMCTIGGEDGLKGAAAASPPAGGFQYTGEIDGPDGPSSLGGSADDGAITDPPSVEKSLNETLSDEPGEPTVDCADARDGLSLECEVSGEGVTGTLTATPIGGFEWNGHLETPDGLRSISGNELP